MDVEGLGESRMTLSWCTGLLDPRRPIAWGWDCLPCEPDAPVSVTRWISLHLNQVPSTTSHHPDK